ncbi:hypothetical protein P3H15_44405 [Rhodococcus sp. T2V]|uniref:hypothetical protein n=1 Tax=Rhodococcus sp. T2V TaxID=3034164 RepID=UPI0023E14D4D|nr:hypothetical protein [Rhodococcus sp. T2V]MDF3312021.1 hypothetical protein [Rhodococcus sp. T2V]
MKLDLVLRQVHRSEHTLALALSALAARHKADHEIHHVALDLADWSQDHLRRLAAAGTRYGIDLNPDPSTEALTTPVQEELGELLGRRPEPALILLMDLRHLHRVTAGVSLDWELLAQGSQATKDKDLLALTQRCHPQTLRQLRWSNTLLKVLAPQTLAT